MKLTHPDTPDVVIDRRPEDAAQYLNSGWVEAEPEAKSKK